MPSPGALASAFLLSRRMGALAVCHRTFIRGDGFRGIYDYAISRHLSPGSLTDTAAPERPAPTSPGRAKGFPAAPGSAGLILVAHLS